MASAIDQTVASDSRSQIIVRAASESFQDVFTSCRSAVSRYGFEIEFRSLEPPRTGTFDGRRIVIDPAVNIEMQTFLLLHLFGHSVQWVAPSIEHELDGLLTTTEQEAFLKILRAYEFKAARFGIQLLHEAGYQNLDDWFSDFVATDWCYVERFYREGRIPPWEECLIAGAPTVQPLLIPTLILRDVQVRYAF